MTGPEPAGRTDTSGEATFEDPDDVRVGIAEYAITDDGADLVTSGLGSCVGVALHHAPTGVRGLAHVMLPEAEGDQGAVRPAKYASTGVRRLVEEMEAAGADPAEVTAHIAGGSKMLSLSQEVGRRNVAAVRDVLGDLDIPIVSEDVGGDVGRSLVFTTEGDLVVRHTGDDRD